MNILQSLGSKNKFILHEFDGDDPRIRYCMVCRVAIRGPYYRYQNYILHKSCAELSGKIQHPLHPRHPLRIHCSSKRVDDDLVCDGCQTYSRSYKYRCKMCNVKLDFQCVSKHVEGQELKERVEKVTDYHQHKLQLLYIICSPDEDRGIICCCCLKEIRGSAYACLNYCRIFIHESCLHTIPEQVKSSFHPQHPLLPRIVLARELKDCKACLEVVHGIELGCRICNYSFHVSCGKHTAPGLRLKDQEHALFYFHDWFQWRICNICDRGMIQGPTYRCMERGKSFHVECLVPPVLNHECHDHQLTLTSSVVPKGNAANTKKYRCDVCEEEENFEHYVYHCEECFDYNVHIECVFSEEDNPPLVDSEQQIDEVQEAETEDDEVQDSETEEDDQESQESFYSRRDSEKSSDEEQETHETEIDTEQKSDLEDCSLSELNEKIRYVTKMIDKLTIELNFLKEMYTKKIMLSI